MNETHVNLAKMTIETEREQQQRQQQERVERKKRRTESKQKEQCWWWRRLCWRWREKTKMKTEKRKRRIQPLRRRWRKDEWLDEFACWKCLTPNRIELKNDIKHWALSCHRWAVDALTLAPIAAIERGSQWFHSFETIHAQSHLSFCRFSRNLGKIVLWARRKRNIMCTIRKW